MPAPSDIQSGKISANDLVKQKLMDEANDPNFSPFQTGTNTADNAFFFQPEIGSYASDPKLKDPILSEKDFNDLGEQTPEMVDFLTNIMRTYGWPNADMWASRFYQAFTQNGVNPANMGSLAASIGRKFANNPELGFQMFLSELQAADVDFNFDPSDQGQTGNLLFPSGSGGGYGGGGFSTRTYIPPDRREVVDTVRGMLGGLVGRADKARVESLADDFMAEHKHAWEKPELGISPWATIREKVRNSEDFKRIHKLRPDSVNEEEWVTLHQKTAVAAGMLVDKNFEQFAINQAQIGSTAEDSAGAAGVSEFSRGRKTDQFKQRLASSSRAMFAGLR